MKRGDVYVKRVLLWRAARIFGGGRVEGARPWLNQAREKMSVKEETEKVVDQNLSGPSLGSESFVRVERNHF